MNSLSGQNEMFPMLCYLPVFCNSNSPPFFFCLHIFSHSSVIHPPNHSLLPLCDSVILSPFLEGLVFDVILPFHTFSMRIFFFFFPPNWHRALFFPVLEQKPCIGRLDWTRRLWQRRCVGAQKRICWVLLRVTPTCLSHFMTLWPVVTTRWASRKVWWKQLPCKKIILILYSSPLWFLPFWFVPWHSVSFSFKKKKKLF